MIAAKEIVFAVIVSVMPGGSVAPPGPVVGMLDLLIILISTYCSEYKLGSVT